MTPEGDDCDRKGLTDAVARLVSREYWKSWVVGGDDNIVVEEVWEEPLSGTSTVCSGQEMYIGDGKKPKKKRDRKTPETF